MELENLRMIWRIAMEPPPARIQPDEQILALLRKRSQGLVAKMKRNLFGELILVLGIYTPAILFYLIEFGGKGAEMAKALFLLTVLFAGYFYQKNKLLNEMQCMPCAIRSNLQRQVVTLRKYVRFYTIAGTILVPVMAVFSFLVTRRNLFLSSPASLSYPLSGPFWWKSGWFWSMSLIAVTVLSYFANTWSMNNLYGRHIKNLQQLLREIDEDPGER